MKIYIAGPFFNEQQLETVKVVERILDEAGIEYHSPRSVGVLKDMPKEERLAAMKGIFDSNLRQMDDCTEMVCILNDRDTGTLVEFGYMLAQRKDITFFADDAKFVSVMLAQGASAICTDEEKLVDAINGDYSETIGDTI